MSAKKHFLQDRTALLLVSGNGFLALAAVVLLLLKLSAHSTANYIVQCRDCSNVGNIDRFTNGTVSGPLSFILFAVMVLVIGLVLGYRAYPIKRHLSLTILALTMPLLFLAIIVSNALLAL